jgi:hypothetical protein
MDPHSRRGGQGWRLSPSRRPCGAARARTATATFRAPSFVAPSIRRDARRRPAGRPNERSQRVFPFRNDKNAARMCRVPTRCDATRKSAAWPFRSGQPSRPTAAAAAAWQAARPLDQALPPTGCTRAPPEARKGVHDSQGEGREGRTRTPRLDWGPALWFVVLVRLGRAAGRRRESDRGIAPLLRAGRPPAFRGNR